jgi:hypothetical protein
MLIFGAVDFAAALSQAGRFLGYRGTVCDARPVFATTARFPHADEIVVDWPHHYLEHTEVDPRTGATAPRDYGIGRATAIRPAEAGLDIGVTWHRDHEGAQRTADEVRETGRAPRSSSWTSLGHRRSRTS